VAISQYATASWECHRRNRSCLPEIATAPLGPRNDNSGAFTILTTACTGCEYRAGRGMPGPYNGVSEIKGARKIKGSSELINKSGWREIFWQGEVWKTQEYFVYFKFFIPMDCRKRSGIRRR